MIRGKKKGGHKVMAAGITSSEAKSFLQGSMHLYGLAQQREMKM